MISIGVIGATGYAGQQIVGILAKHPFADIRFLSSYNYTGIPFDSLYRQYEDFIQVKCIDSHSAEEILSDVDVVFIALPHGKAFDITQLALQYDTKVIDLGADFRLNRVNTYKQWYGLDHLCPELLTKAAYGLPELHSKEIKNSMLVANPGCYPTASILALAPLIKGKLINSDSIIIDAKSGVSGAGRSANIANLFTEVNESIKAYSVASHRHTPEIEQELSKLHDSDLNLSFTPHLIPMNRGILTTCYGNLTQNLSTEELYELYRDFYKDEYFVRVVDELPETRWVRGSNFCDIAVRVDPRTSRVTVISVIDNLIKGAAGQAVQNMNLMFGIKETEGLEIFSMIP